MIQWSNISLRNRLQWVLILGFFVLLLFMVEKDSFYPLVLTSDYHFETVSPLLVWLTQGLISFGADYLIAPTILTVVFSIVALFFVFQLFHTLTKSKLFGLLVSVILLLSGYGFFAGSSAWFFVGWISGISLHFLVVRHTVDTITFQRQLTWLSLYFLMWGFYAPYAFFLPTILFLLLFFWGFQRKSMTVFLPFLFWLIGISPMALFHLQGGEKTPFLDIETEEIAGIPGKEVMQDRVDVIAINHHDESVLDLWLVSYILEIQKPVVLQSSIEKDGWYRWKRKGEEFQTVLQVDQTTSGVQFSLKKYHYHYLDRPTSVEQTMLLTLQAIFHKEWFYSLSVVLFWLGQWGLFLVVPIILILTRKDWTSCGVEILKLVGIAVTVGLVIGLIKSGVMRPRPLAEMSYLIDLVNYWFDPLYARSFPSGDAQAGMTLLFVLAWFRPHLKWLLILAPLIAINRVICGVHFPFDVFVGLLVGLAVAWWMLIWMEKNQPGNLTDQ